MSIRNARKKKPLWLVRNELMEDLKVLKKNRREFRAIIISLLSEAIHLKETSEESNPLVIANSVRKRGGHSASTVHEFFDEMKKYSPRLIKPFRNYDEVRAGWLEYAMYDVLDHDVKTWNALDRNGLVSDSERRDIQMIAELLDEFYGKTNGVGME
jgi:hypothetical protein